MGRKGAIRACSSKREIGTAPTFPKVGIVWAVLSYRHSSACSEAILESILERPVAVKSISLFTVHLVSASVLESRESPVREGDGECRIPVFTPNRARQRLDPAAGALQAAGLSTSPIREVEAPALRGLDLGHAWAMVAEQHLGPTAESLRQHQMCAAHRGWREAEAERSMDSEPSQITAFLIWWATGVSSFAMLLLYVRRLFSLLAGQHKPVIDIAGRSPTAIGRMIAIPLVLLIAMSRCFPEINDNPAFSRLRNRVLLVSAIVAIFVWVTALLGIGLKGVTLGR